MASSCPPLQASKAYLSNHAISLGRKVEFNFLNKRDLHLLKVSGICVGSFFGSMNELVYPNLVL